jgi:DNA-binding transcriptional MerR regulator
VCTYCLRTMKNTFTLKSLEEQSGVPARRLRNWIRLKLLPRPLGRGRSACYDAEHLLRARVVEHLRDAKLALPVIRRRMASMSAAELRALVPVVVKGKEQTVVPTLPVPVAYPATMVESVRLMEGLTLLVDPAVPGLRRLADEIYRHYGAARG